MIDTTQRLYYQTIYGILHNQVHFDPERARLFDLRPDYPGIDHQHAFRIGDDGV